MMGPAARVSPRRKVVLSRLAPMCGTMFLLNARIMRPAQRRSLWGLMENRLRKQLRSSSCSRQKRSAALCSLKRHRIRVVHEQSIWQCFLALSCRATTELGGDAASEGRDGATIVGWLVPVRWFERSMPTSSTRARRHNIPKARYLSDAKFSIGSETSRLYAGAQV